MFWRSMLCASTGLKMETLVSTYESSHGITTQNNTVNSALRFETFTVTECYKILTREDFIAIRNLFRKQKNWEK
jgi:hypothetical protein